MERISCIIPAYNEEKNLHNVLSVVTDHPSIAQVIVIDDGSIDGTKQIAAAFSNIKVLVNAYNKGKTASICRGIIESSSPYILLLDADLTGLTSENIDALIEPVRSGSSAVSISLRDYHTWRIFGVDPLTGDRLFPKSLLLDHLEELATMPPFSIEVFINALLIDGEHSFTIVPWENVHAPLKASKYGLVSGMLEEVRMWKDIGSYVEFSTLLRQFWDMRRIAKESREL